MRIVVATGNQGKVREIRDILGGQFEVVSMKELGIEADMEETGSTFAQNAAIKAQAVYKLCGEVTIADDSGLCVQALGGAPGVYSARYAGEGHNDAANNEKLLHEMHGVQERSAYFACAVCCVYPGGSFTVEGQCPGVIANTLQGEGGFGYDPLFYLPQYQKTFAQLSMEDKNAISHRGKALQLFAQEIQRRFGAQGDE